MSATHFNWFKLIAEMKDGSSGIPTDLIFEVVENGKLYEVNAHKMLLAMVSPSFKPEFYATESNAWIKTGNVIKIEEISFSALQTMTDAVYDINSMEATLKDKSVDAVFEVVNLVDRYQIAKLMDAVKKYLANYPVTDDMVLEVAGYAKEYINTFKAEAELLLRTCAMFLKAKLKDLDGMSTYAAEHEDQVEVVGTLLAKMKNITEPIATTTPISFNWSKIISEMTDESCGIPTDVTFQIVEDEIKAHKMILAMVSDVFKTMFYATEVGDKTASVIKIEKTTASAFRIMMDAVYNVKSVQASLKGKSVHEVYDVMNLVERYQIKELMEASKKHLANYPINDDTVLEVAEDATEYREMFEAESKDLLVRCAKFLHPRLGSLKAVTRYAAEHEDKGEVITTLLAKMNDIVPWECVNCMKEVCQDGEEVKDDEFREGLVVTNKKRRSYLGISDLGIGKVTKVEAERVTVENITPGVTQNGLTGSHFNAAMCWEWWRFLRIPESYGGFFEGEQTSAYFKSGSSIVGIETKRKSLKSINGELSRLKVFKNGKYSKNF